MDENPTKQSKQTGDAWTEIGPAPSTLPSRQDAPSTEPSPATDNERSSDIDSFLDTVAAMPKHQRPRPERRGRLIFALDATASREPMWDRACHIQGEMFEATAALGGLDIQLVFYRGFRECQAGRWVADAAALHRQMRQVSCVGGHTQIERVLKHALRENTKKPVQAVVFVGDALEEDIDSLCHQAGQLGVAGVPVFMFQDGHDPIVRKAFEQIARLSGGAWAPFDLASAGALKELLRVVAVYAAGGHAALDRIAANGGEGARLLIGQMRS